MAEICVPGISPVDIVGNFPRDLFLLATVDFPVGLLGRGGMENSELTCKTCRPSVPYLLPVQDWGTSFLRRSKGYQGLQLRRLVGDEWEVSHLKGNLGGLRYQVHQLCGCGPLHHANRILRH
jgi:hypothetical protein